MAPLPTPVAGHTPGLPWVGLKIAYGCDDDEALWAAHDNDSLVLPAGWSLNETDCSGARCVAVFLVETLPSIEDGEKVLAAIAKAEGRPTLSDNPIHLEGGEA